MPWFIDPVTGEDRFYKEVPVLDETGDSGGPGGYAGPKGDYNPDEHKKTGKMIWIGIGLAVLVIGGLLLNRKKGGQ